MKAPKITANAGILTALASSVCCITPLLAMVAGTSSLASTFDWIGQARPYFIIGTVLILGFAWYQHLKPVPEVSCNCEPESKPFMQTKKFLSLVTLAAVLLITFPSYSGLVYQQNQEAQQPISKKGQTAFIKIKGMTCEGCEQHIKQEVNKLKGIHQVQVSYKTGSAAVKYDSTKTSLAEIKKAVDATGYKVVETTRQL
ncbi:MULTISPECIES: mercuric transport protein MerTP [Dyadobacter]|uniref:Mercuric transport protein MerT n=1 Tax=Dyadobacter psychrotolerans TaxID=2541721 RepID=A0A4R5DFK4_9BACT|nr:mercuric transport protein MerTP [Dyadobacter psychrotolerans]TDE09425.1 mercuric transport protein MerTP [Dyadobacter psychrotolerans]